MDVPIKLSLHQGQREVFNDPHRFITVVCGRRWGKSSFGLVSLLIHALSFKEYVDPRFPVTFIAVMPTANQARGVIWKPLLNLLSTPEFKYVVKPKGINRTAMQVELLNGVYLKVVGANDSAGDRLRGLKMAYVWFDEAQDIKPVVWEEVVRAALSDTPGSRGLFTGTPKGFSNFLYDLSQRSENDPEWSFHNKPTASNPFVSRKEIALAKASLPDRLFRQEYYGSFENFPGMLYSELDSENKFYGELPRLNLTVLGVDWGDLFCNLSVIGRGDDRRWYYLEGWQGNLSNPKHPQPIPDPVLHHNIKRLVKKWSVQHTYADPSRPSSIIGLRSLGSEPGFRNAVAGYNRILEGISQVHSKIKQKDLLFTEGHHDNLEGCYDGLLAYDYHASYHRETDKDGNFTDVPADGIFSHTCDSVRYSLASNVGGLR